MIPYRLTFFLYLQRYVFTTIIIGSGCLISFGSDTIPSITKLYDVANIDIEPVFLYDYLQVYSTPDTVPSSLSQHTTKHNFGVNNTKDNYDNNYNYYVRLSLYNSGWESRELLLNFSPNNWNQSWDFIQINTSRDTQLIRDVCTGYSIKNRDKPVHSVMNLLNITVKPDEYLTIQVFLQGSEAPSVNTPNHIDFVLLEKDQSAGLISGYPYDGTFIQRESLSAFETNDIINHEIYIDESQSKSITDIREEWSSLVTHDLFNIPHETNGVYWLKSQLIGSRELSGRQIFMISNKPNWDEANYSPAADNFSYNYIDAFYHNTNGELIHQRVGDHISARDRPLRFWANFLTVDVPLGDTLDYYVRLEGGDRRFPMTSIVMNHINPLSIFPQQVNEGWTHGLYYGALGVYLLFFFLLFIVERESLYWYFSLFILGLLMMNIFSEDIYTRYVVFPTWRDWHVPLYFAGAFCQSFGILKFTENFFLIAKQSNISRFIIPGFLIAFGIITLVCIINFEYVLIWGNPVHKPYMQLFIFMQLVMILVPFIIALTAKKKKGASKFSYFFSFSPLVFAAIFHFGNILLPNIINVNGFESAEEINTSFDFIKIGVAAMLTLFALNVGFRSNILKADKEQALKLAEKNEIIEAKSKQNETLLKEIHHRVKNNLQTISSLLYLQSYGEKNQQTKENIAITQQRVESMALIHKNLYQRENLAEIEMKDYIKSLCDNLISAYQTQDKKVRLEMDMPTFELDIDRAIPMGLIINELVTNSLKHAFPQAYNGLIRITFSSDDLYNSLTISDNGVGKTADSGSSFGTQLIKLLTKQINATLTSENDSGLRTNLTWPKHADITL